MEKNFTAISTTGHLTVHLRSALLPILSASIFHQHRRLVSYRQAQRNSRKYSINEAKCCRMTININFLITAKTIRCHAERHYS